MSETFVVNLTHHDAENRENGGPPKVDVDLLELRKLLDAGLVQLSPTPAAVSMEGGSKRAILGVLAEYTPKKGSGSVQIKSPSENALSNIAKRRQRQQASGFEPQTRREELFGRVYGNPGLTVRQYADAMGLKDATGLYRTVKQLVSDNIIIKDDKALYLSDEAQNMHIDELRGIVKDGRAL